MTLDTLLYIVIAFLAVAMAVLGGHVSSARKIHKMSFWAMGAISALLIVWQGFSTQASQRQAAEHSAGLRDLLVKQGQEINSLKNGISQRDEELAKINRQRLSVAEEQFALDYAPSVDMLYENGRLKIYNRGKTNLSVWGTKLGSGPKAIDKEPRIISPNPDTFYYLLTDVLEKEIIQRLGQNGEDRVPFELFIQDARQHKYTASYILWIVVRNGQIAIHTQNTGILNTDWSK